MIMANQVTAGEIEILKGLGMLGKKLDGLNKPEKYPLYIARNDDQMENELRQKGKLNEAQKEGLGEDRHEAFKMYLKLTEQGKLVDGLVDGNQEQPSVMNMIHKVDYRGLSWNYFWGQVNAFKCGLDDGKKIPEKNAKKKIEEIRARYPTDKANAIQHYQVEKLFEDTVKNFDWNDRTESHRYVHKSSVPTTMMNYYDKNGNKLYSVGISGNYAGDFPNTNIGGGSLVGGEIPLGGEAFIDYIRTIKMRNKFD